MQKIVLEVSIHELASLIRGMDNIDSGAISSGEYALMRRLGTEFRQRGGFAALEANPDPAFEDYNDFDPRDVEGR